MGATMQTTREVDGHVSHFEAFERTAGKNAPAWIAAMRREAMGRFSELGFPTTRQEEWRFTNVSAIARTAFVPAPRRIARAECLGEPLVALPGAVRVVLVDGRFEPGLSAGASSGVSVRSLGRVLAEEPEALKPHLGRLADVRTNAFTALNTAFLEDGAVVTIAPRAVVDAPVEIVHVATAAAEPSMRHPRILVVAGEGSQARLVETYLTQGDGAAFTNAVTEIVADPGAVLDHYRVQNESAASSHVARLEASIGASAAYRLHMFSFGAALSRYDVNAALAGEGADAILNGLYISGGTQHVDHHTGIDHASAHCTSHELFKGILDGRSTGVFNGRILVRPGAQKTDSKQTNKNLLLSADALVQTNPQLEIYADDVKCTHGATIGQMDETALFYLRSRGIPAAQASGILTIAFAAELVAGVRIDALRAALDGWVTRRLRGREDSL